MRWPIAPRSLTRREATMKSRPLTILALAGAVLVEASKQVYAVGVRAQGRRRRPVAVPAIRLVQSGTARVPGAAVSDARRS